MFDSWSASVPEQRERSKKSVDIHITPTLQVSEFNVVKQAAIQGIGFAFLPTYMVQQELRDGSLRELFADWRVHPYGRSVFLLRLRERYVSPAVMRLSAFIRSECARREISTAR
ncbi:LysR substrate-binding domain-containing protein [Cupriavidus basilensis]|uniref:LysR substrate-binding domain-containing protein n=1 Tax=Cupriavidus basilensis TaxID=68895 RepID=UPI0023E8DA7C|nr:LysR substrate-binding domain-containing protein [Cupriavidus basilensis]MDF3882423.1 LysR substrate-binding domain-containing protein [Cupriavidus basilensis]